MVSIVAQASSVGTSVIHFLPILSTIVAAAFSLTLYKVGDTSSRVLGNIHIAVGAILPGIGGSFARAGAVEVLYVTELIGLLPIWAGFRVISGDRVISVFSSQRPVAARSA
jgi:hypothetical protein